MITTAELSPAEYEQKRAREREEHTKANSPSLMQRVTKALTGRTDAERALAEASAKAEAELQRQRRFNVFDSRRKSLLASVEKGELLVKTLPQEISGWEIAVREHLLVPGVQAQSQRSHAAAQVAELRVMVEQLPATLKGLRQNIRSVEQEMKALEEQS